MKRLQHLGFLTMTNVICCTPTTAIELLSSKMLKNFINEKGLLSYIRFKDCIKTRWDGIGNGKSRGTIFSWSKSCLGIWNDLPKVDNRDRKKLEINFNKGSYGSV